MSIAAYVLYGTPRSGSTLLCETLAATGVAGRPRSYFRAGDIEEWADAWEVPHPQGVEVPNFDRAYLAAMRREGSPDTDVFGLRLMWASTDDAARRLGRALGKERDVALSFEEAFGMILLRTQARRHLRAALPRLGTLDPSRSHARQVASSRSVDNASLPAHLIACTMRAGLHAVRCCRQVGRRRRLDDVAVRRRRDESTPWRR